MGLVNKYRRLAIRFAVYIDLLGAIPIPYNGQSFKAFAAELDRQYQQLKTGLDAQIISGALKSGRILIREHGFAEIERRLADAGTLDLLEHRPLRIAPRTADLSIGPQSIASLIDERIAPESRLIRNCRRKLRHTNYLTALLHARRLQEPDLQIYPCSLCQGLHIGHDPGIQARRLRNLARELRLVERTIQDVEHRLAALMAQRTKLLVELGRPESALGEQSYEGAGTSPYQANRAARGTHLDQKNHQSSPAK